jgi:hypothetical protein
VKCARVGVFVCVGERGNYHTQAANFGLLLSSDDVRGGREERYNE